MLSTLRRIVQEVNSAPDLEEALRLIVHLVREAIKADVCSVYLMDFTHKRYALMATEGLNPDAVGKVYLGVSEGLVGQVGMREEPVNIENAPSHPRFRYLKETGEEKFNAFLGVPIIHQAKVLGVLVVQHVENRQFDEGEEAFLVTVSAQLAGVIAHAEASGDFAEFTGHTDGNRIEGVKGATGVAIGHGAVVFPLADLDAVPDRKPESIPREVRIFRIALQAVRQDIRDLQVRLEDSLRMEERDLFDVYLRVLDNNSLGGEIVQKIREGHWSQGALRIVVQHYVKNFELMEDPYLRERSADVKDMGMRILARLQQVGPVRVDYPDDTILLGEEITTSMLMEVPGDKLCGIVSVKGSMNSHMAIVARALGVPTVVGAQDLPLDQLEGSLVVVDGYRGNVFTHPSDGLIKHYSNIIEEEKQIVAGLEAYRDLPAVTKDGQSIALWVNTGLLVDVTRSLDQGAEGVGLYRSEIPFMVRDRFPSENEQEIIYREQLDAFAPRPVTVRTLDIGGDKALPYFPISEENPFLGWRGIRITLDHPEIFLVQIRAMLKASVGLDNLRILMPMISTVLEVEEACYLIHRAYHELLEEGFKIIMPPVGVMIEIPAAVHLTKNIASRVDFISVGSNDLTQYLLAVDRNNARVANLYQSLHPSVLHALKYIVDICHQENKPVSICGEMAGEPASALLLTAMGFDSLSMSASSLLKVKAAIRQVDSNTIKGWLFKVLEMDSPEIIRSYLDLEMEAEGLRSLERPGM